MTKKVQTDEYAKKKAVKLVVLHVRKKLEEAGEEAHELDQWFIEMEELLELPESEFDIHKYYDMRRQLNDHIDCIYDVNLRYKLRDSWISFGKALDKKAKKQN